MAKFGLIGGKLELQRDDGGLVWASDAVPVALFPASATISVSGQAFSFPDFQKSNYMYWHVRTDFGFQVSQVISYGTVLPGEYGPDKSGVYELADILLGTVPAATNFIEVQARFSRTSAPDNLFHQPFLVDVKLNQWTSLDGGCAMLESRGDTIRRIVQIARVGNSLYLRRRQSVKAGTWNGFSPLKGSAQVWTGGSYTAWTNVWTHGGTSTGWPAWQIAKAEYLESSLVNRARGSGGAPSFTDPSDFSSDWTVDLEIRPGYVRD